MVTFVGILIGVVFCLLAQAFGDWVTGIKEHRKHARDVAKYRDQQLRDDVDYLRGLVSKHLTQPHVRDHVFDALLKSHDHVCALVEKLDRECKDVHDRVSALEMTKAGGFTTFVPPIGHGG